MAKYEGESQDDSTKDVDITRILIHRIQCHFLDNTALQPMRPIPNPIPQIREQTSQQTMRKTGTRSRQTKCNFSKLSKLQGEKEKVKVSLLWLDRM